MNKVWSTHISVLPSKDSPTMFLLGLAATSPSVVSHQSRTTPPSPRLQWKLQRRSLHPLRTAPRRSQNGPSLSTASLMAATTLYTQTPHPSKPLSIAETLSISCHPRWPMQSTKHSVHPL